MSPRRRDAYAWWEYALMGLVALLIVGGGLLLVRVVTSSEQDTGASAPTRTQPATPRCTADEWLDPAIESCVPKAVCPAGQVYAEETNTCALPAPRAASLEPDTGPAKGGTEVTIVGFDFQRGATVTIGGVPGVDTEVIDSSTIITRTPPSAVDYPVDIVITNPDGQSGRLDNAYVYALPQEQAIREVVPDTGSTQGGEAVVIKGRGFVDGAVVSFNGRPATDVEVLGPDTIRAIIPPSDAGPASVNVRNPGQDPWTLRDGFTYADQAPRLVSTVRPGRGPAAGGTRITIIGSGFTSGAEVLVGGEPARRVQVVGSTRITAITPAGGVGPADVAVRNPGIPAAILVDGFVFVEAPTIDSVAPARGPIKGGTTVTITGSGFADDAIVTFGDVTLADVRVIDEGTIRLTTPPAAEPLTVAVTVTNPGQPTATLRRAFTYRAPAAQPTPTATPTPTPTTPARLERCPSFTRPFASTAPGAGLVLTDVDLFPSDPRVARATLVDAGVSSGPGSISWQESPPRIEWAAPASGGSATITYAYESPSCRGFGTGTIAVSAR